MSGSEPARGTVRPVGLNHVVLNVRDIQYCRNGSRHGIEAGDCGIVPAGAPDARHGTGVIEHAIYAPKHDTFPNGCHVCELEIDPDTGAVALLSYLVGDDAGTVINPLTLAGQIHGGVA